MDLMVQKNQGCQTCHELYLEQERKVFARVYNGSIDHPCEYSTLPALTGYVALIKDSIVEDHRLNAANKQCSYHREI
jgi:hypothetical protein